MNKVLPEAAVTDLRGASVSSRSDDVQNCMLWNIFCCHFGAKLLVFLCIYKYGRIYKYGSKGRTVLISGGLIVRLETHITGKVSFGHLNV